MYYHLIAISGWRKSLFMSSDPCWITVLLSLDFTFVFIFSSQPIKLKRQSLGFSAV